MKKTKQKKQQEKVQQEASKPFGFEETLAIINEAESELERKVKRFRAKGRDDKQIAALLMVNYELVKAVK